MLVRRFNVVAVGLIWEHDVPAERPVQVDLFTDYGKLTRLKESEEAADAREKRLQEAALHIHERFGKNAMIKGMNLKECGTTIGHIGQVGRHKA